MKGKLLYLIKEKVILKMKIKDDDKNLIISIFIIILLSIGIYFSYKEINKNIYRIIDDRIELKNYEVYGM